MTPRHRASRARPLPAASPCASRQLTADLAGQFRSACEQAGLTLTVICSALSEPAYVDHEMWEIVLNLLSNAFKFTHEVEIRVTFQETNGVAELTVRDTGVGITEAELPRIFERFHRVEAAQARTFEGSGIGLALVKDLVDLHGGDISAESVFGSGTTFTVRIPLGQHHLPPNQIETDSVLDPNRISAGACVAEALHWLPAASVPRAPTLPEEAGNNKPHLLLADDNADMRANVTRLLDPYYVVTSVSDGAAAVAAAREGSPDMVLLDVMMPVLDGFGVINALRADPRTELLPIILLSARAGEEARVEGLAAGADDYLVKPFPARELLARIDGTIRLASMRAEREGVQRELKIKEAMLSEIKTPGKKQPSVYF